MNEKKPKYRLAIWDEHTGNISVESNPDSLTSVLIWKEENKRRYKLKKDNAILIGKYGEKMSLFQEAMKKVAKELNAEEIRIFAILISVCDFENFIRVKQSDIAKELNMNTSHISRGLKGLKEKKFIEVYKNGKDNFYRISPEIGWKGSYDSWKKEINIIEFNKKSKNNNVGGVKGEDI